MQYLLDTDTCIDLLRGLAGTTARASLVSPDACAVSAVTTYELLSGAARCTHPDRERHKIATFLAAIAELPFDHNAASHAADIRADLEGKGLPIGSYDLQIAGQALAAGLTLVTSNGREFGRVKGLRLEDWR